MTVALAMTDREAGQGEGSLFDSALRYASWGWPVFRLAPRSKEPLKGTHGYKDANTDPEIVRSWWTETPDANIGIATGDGLTVLDADVKNGKDGLWALGHLRDEFGLPQDTLIVNTPSGGLHVYLRDPQGQASGVDVWDFDGLDVRGKGGYVVAPPSALDNGRYSFATEPDTPLAAFPEGLRELGRKPGAAPCIAMDGRWLEGTRHKNLLREAGRLAGVGVLGDALEARLLTANAERCEPPLPEDEVRRIARDMTTKEEAKDGAVRRISFYTVDELLAQPGLEWLIPGLVRKGGLHMLYADTGVGKTFVALSLAAHVSEGLAWHVSGTERAPAYYFVLEGSEGFTRRLTAIRQRFGVSLDGLRLASEPIDLSDKRRWRGVVEAFKDLPPGLVVIDTLSQARGELDITAPRDATMALKAMRDLQQLGYTVAFVHHTGHRPNRETGAKDLRNYCDVVLRLDKSRGNKRELTITVEKNRDADSGAKFLGELAGAEVDGGTTLVYVPTPVGKTGADASGEASARQDPRKELLLDALEVLAQHSEGLSFTAWRTAMPRSVPETTFRRSRSELVKRKLVSGNGGRGARYTVTECGFEHLRANGIAVPDGVCVDACSDGGGGVSEPVGDGG